MGNFKFLEPAYCINRFRNGSLERGLYHNVGGTTYGLYEQPLAVGVVVSSSDEQARHGNKSGKVVTPGADKGCRYTDNINVTGGTWSASVYVWSQSAFTMTMKVWRWETLCATQTFAILGSGRWQRLKMENISLPGAAAEARIDLLASGAVTFYVDSYMMTETTAAQPYFDGYTPGCRWVGLIAQSHSERPIHLRSGGVVRDFETYGYYISAAMNMGVPRIEQLTEPQALLPGSQHEGLHVNEREFALVGTIGGDDYAGLLANRAALTAAIRPTDLEPTLLLFDGGARQVMLPWRYSGGLEGGRQNVASEPLTLKGLAVDPEWVEDDQTVVTLDHQDTPDLQHAAYCLKNVDGHWQTIASTSGNGLSGGAVRAIAHDPISGYTYLGGDFTQVFGANWKGFCRTDGADMLACGALVDWVGTNGAVYAILPLQNGKILLGGSFTIVYSNGLGSALAANYLALFDPATGTYSTVGANNGTGTVWALAQHPRSGHIAVGGLFANWAGIAAADNLALYDATFANCYAISTGVNGQVDALAYTPTGVLYVGGAFTTSGNGATTLNRLAKCPDLVNLQQVTMGTAVGMNGRVYALRVLRDGGIAMGGDFTTAGGVTVNRVCIYDGSAFRNLASGVSGGGVKCIDELTTGELVIGGALTTASGLTGCQGVVMWTGAAYALLGHTYGGTPTYYVIEQAPWGDLWVGHDVNAGAVTDGVTVAVNPGTADVFPDLVLRGTNGLIPVMVQNMSVPGQPAIYFDPTMFSSTTLAGEVITVHTGKPPAGAEQIESSYGRHGLSVIPGSALATFFLRPGQNRIVARSMSAVGAIATLRFSPRHLSRDT